MATAWLVIFLHAVIPHHHIDIHPKECTSVYHCCHSKHTDQERHGGDAGIPRLLLGETETENHNHFICHFTSGPYQPLDNDIPIIAATATYFSWLPETGNPVHEGYVEPFPDWRHRVPNFRRGPPPLLG